MATILVLLVALTLLWLYAPRPRPVKVRRTPLPEELLAADLNRRGRR